MVFISYAAGELYKYLFVRHNLNQIVSFKMKSTGKYEIITGITNVYKINPANPKYFAKFINDNIMCLGNTENEAINRLKKLYEEYKRKNKLHGLLSKQVLNASVSIEKFEKYMNTSIEFFELIGEDPYCQIDDEFTVEDFEFNEEQIRIIKKKYGRDIQPENYLVDIFEKINKSSA